MLNFLNMKYCLTVAEERSFSAAANRLYISQQALSSHIAQMEKELGGLLFERTRPLTVTPLGEKFLRGAKELLFINTQMERELTDMVNSSGNSLKVGISSAYASALLPTLMDRFYTSHPLVNLQVYELNYDKLHEGLCNNILDLIITRPPYGDKEAQVIPLRKNDDVYLYAPLVAIKRAYGNRASEIAYHLKNKASLSVVKDCPFILTRVGSVRKSALQMCLNAQVTPKIRSETDTLETAIALCRSGLGITIAPSTLLHTYAGVNAKGDVEGAYLLSTSRPEHALAICYLERVHVTKVMRAFIEITKNVVPFL